MVKLEELTKDINNRLYELEKEKEFALEQIKEKERLISYFDYAQGQQLIGLRGGFK